jgi:cation:H+ antiporter
MALPLIAVLAGLALLVWSADRFVEGSASAAHHFRVPPLLIGMLVVGFGTSAPEMAVSALAAWQGNPAMALGNAYGSNITNIALVLGLSALISPVAVRSQVLRKELPILTAVTLLAAWQLHDGSLSRIEAVLLLGVFAGLMAWTIRQGLRTAADNLGNQMQEELNTRTMSIRRAIAWVVAGLALLLFSSRLLVWGAVEIASRFGVSDLTIGLTVVAIGTSLPELASSIAAARKREHDLALGNVLGSNLFNTLAVVGIAGAIHPADIGTQLARRDIPVMGLLTVSLFAIGYGIRRPGRINRVEGTVLLACYIAYVAIVVSGVTGR